MDCLCRFESSGSETNLFVSYGADRSQSGRGQTLLVGPSTWSTSAQRTSLEVKCYISFFPQAKVKQTQSKNVVLPFSRLRLQGFSKTGLTLTQPAKVFKLLAKLAPVVAITPLSFKKSSAWLLLKFPHNPEGIKSHFLILFIPLQKSGF